MGKNKIQIILSFYPLRGRSPEKFCRGYSHPTVDEDNAVGCENDSGIDAKPTPGTVIEAGHRDDVVASLDDLGGAEDEIACILGVFWNRQKQFVLNLQSVPDKKADPFKYLPNIICYRYPP